MLLENSGQNNYPAVKMTSSKISHFQKVRKKEKKVCVCVCVRERERDGEREREREREGEREKKSERFMT